MYRRNLIMLWVNHIVKLAFPLAENCWLSDKRLLQAAIEVLIIPIDQTSKDHFTKSLWVQNWNLFSIPFALISTLMACSCHKFANFITAQLSWHVHNYGMIRSPFFMPEQQIFYKIWVISSWTICRMGTWYLWLDSPEYETKWQHRTMEDDYGHTTALSLTHLPWTKWPPFCIWYFQMHFREWKVLYFG